MRIKNLLDEDFINYKKPALFIGTCECDFKCFKERNLPINTCVNYELSKFNVINIPDKAIVKRYIDNIYTESIVIGGMEPFKQFDEMVKLIKEFRNVTEDDIVIYTGYYEDEIKDELKILKEFKNIIIKFGRYIPNDEEIYDECLGIYLSSSNQYAVKIS